LRSPPPRKRLAPCHPDLGPVDLRDPPGVAVTRVESARDMLHRVEAALPVDIAIFAAAVADWRVAQEGEQKLKKTSASMHRCNWSRIPISWQRLPSAKRTARRWSSACRGDRRSDRQRKGKDCAKGLRLDPRQRRIASDGRDGGDRNTVHLLTRDGSGSGGDSIEVDSWPVMTKEQVASGTRGADCKDGEKAS